MIILDTNVLSALMLKHPDPAVVDWLDTLPPESIWTTSITVYEIHFGLKILADGRKKTLLQNMFQRSIEEDFAGRVLTFDTTSAETAAELSARRREQGRPVEIRDAMISGIALARRGTVATRNVKHFDGFDIPLINPWNT